MGYRLGPGDPRPALVASRSIELLWRAAEPGQSPTDVPPLDYGRSWKDLRAELPALAALAQLRQIAIRNAVTGAITLPAVPGTGGHGHDGATRPPPAGTTTAPGSSRQPPDSLRSEGGDSMQPAARHLTSR